MSVASDAIDEDEDAASLCHDFDGVQSHASIASAANGGGRFA